MSGVLSLPREAVPFESCLSIHLKVRNWGHHHSGRAQNLKADIFKNKTPRYQFGPFASNLMYSIFRLPGRPVTKKGIARTEHDDQSDDSNATIERRSGKHVLYLLDVLCEIVKKEEIREGFSRTLKVLKSGIVR